MGATAVTSESNMGEGQVPKKVKRHILSTAFPVANKNIHDFGQGPASAGKVRVLLPWIALLAAFILAASVLVLRRRRAQT